jgi:hypothetical protein
MGMTIDSTALGHRINVTLPEGFAWPAGGVVVRVRSPAWPQKQISKAPSPPSRCGPPETVLGAQ